MPRVPTMTAVLYLGRNLPETPRVPTTMPILAVNTLAVNTLAVNTLAVNTLSTDPSSYHDHAYLLGGEATAGSHGRSAGRRHSRPAG